MKFPNNLNPLIYKNIMWVYNEYLIYNQLLDNFPSTDMEFMVKKIATEYFFQNLTRTENFTPNKSYFRTMCNKIIVWSTI